MNVRRKLTIKLGQRKGFTSSNKASAWAANAKRLAAQGRIRGIGLPAPAPKKEKKFKQSWREFGGRKIYFRSSWESNFGRYLQWQKEQGMIKDWLHEPQTFWFEGIKRGCVTYLPDFKVIKNDGSHEWMEVKGFMDSKSKTKISRFRKFFPKENLRIVGKKWYKENSSKLALIIPGWEKG